VVRHGDEGVEFEAGVVTGNSSQTAWTMRPAPFNCTLPPVISPNRSLRSAAQIVTKYIPGWE